MPLNHPRGAIVRRRFDRGDGLGGGSSVLLDRPPADQANLVWAFDPDLVGAAEDLVGPAHTLSTPVRTAGPPGFYTFGATDAITFGNSLNTTWSGASGFTVYWAVNPSAGDIGAARQGIGKLGAAQNTFGLSMSNVAGRAYGYVSYDGGVVANYEDCSDTSIAITAAKHVLTMVFDPAQAFGARISLYVDGVLATSTTSSAGSGSLPFNGTGVLTQGFQNAGVPVTVESYIYAYKDVQSAGTILSNYNWIHTTKAW